MKKVTTIATFDISQGDSTVNQQIKRDFVAREVNVCLTSMVEYILKKGWEDREAPFSFEDGVENYYTYPEYIGEYADFSGGTEEQRDAEVERLRDLQSDLYDQMNKENTKEIEGKRGKIEEEIKELESLETEPQEVYEWWSVSGYLCEKLKEQGEVVIESEGIWGRGCSGQAILLDGVITRICSDMEILEFQRNSWAK